MLSCRGQIVAPDIVESSQSGDHIFISDGASNKIIVVDSRSLDVIDEVSLRERVTALHSTDRGLLVLTDGVKGSLMRYNEESLSLEETIEMGYSPSAVVSEGGYYWVVQRYDNELWRVDAISGEHHAIPLVREPVALAALSGGNRLVVANSLPHQAATSDTVAAALNIVDMESMMVVDTLYLPNGSTDVRSIICDNGGHYCYIPHTIARYQIPTNQLDRGWMTTSALTIFDLVEGEIVNTVLLDTPQRGASGVWSGAITDDDRRLYLSLHSSGEVMSIALTSLHKRLERAKEGERITPSMVSWEAIANDAGFLHGIRDFINTHGRGARGIAIAKGAVVGANYFSGKLFKIPLDPILDIDAVDSMEQAAYALKFTSPKASARGLGKPLMTNSIGRGEAFFNDAKLSFQSWQSCASCHPTGARTDGLNWDLLNDGIGNLKQTKSLLYAHQTPPAMVTGIRESASVAVRSGFKYILFSPSKEHICSDIDNYLLSLKALDSPYLKDGELAEEALIGKEIFDRECLSCHSGDYYTDMQSYRVEWATGSEKGKKMDTPTLCELWRTAPYLYDGRAATIEEAVKIHAPSLELTDEQESSLALYLLSL